MNQKLYVLLRNVYYFIFRYIEYEFTLLYSALCRINLFSSIQVVFCYNIEMTHIEKI